MGIYYAVQINKEVYALKGGQREKTKFMEFNITTQIVLLVLTNNF